MTDGKSFFPLKAAVVGALAGAATFFALSAVKAQAVLTVAQVRSNPKAYVGSGEVAVTGMASNIRSDSRSINGQAVPVVKLNLYELDAKGRKGSHYVYAVVPASSFAALPVEGGMATITGPLKWPYEVAAIDP
jgi:hypothetical protein